MTHLLDSSKTCDKVTKHPERVNRIEPPDPDNNLNSKCFCSVGLAWLDKNTEVVMAYPCEHMYHEYCFNKLSKKDKMYCKLCKKSIQRLLRLLDEDIDPQRFADILSVTHYSDMCTNDPINFIDSIFDLTSLFARVPFLEDMNDGKRICEKIFSLNNLTIKVYGMDKLKIEKNKVFIANHVTYLELPMIYYLFGAGFLASSVTDQSKLIQRAKKFIPIMTFDRGIVDKKYNVVDAMRDFVDKHGSICLFPEGMMTHPDTLIKFRTGAFHINRPIYAIVIRHQDVMSDGYINSLIYKICGKNDITMTVHVLGPYYPPFSPEDIEKIRFDMAYHGNMVLSRVSNRDIKDT